MSDTKPSNPPMDNPKDRIGSNKMLAGCVPDTVMVYASMAFTEGMLKYGAYNWRVAGVRSSIYHDALKRHLAKWWNGEWADPVTKVPHLASILACAGIVLDANLANKLTDDRPPSVPMSALIDSQDELVKHLKELFADKDPRHWTIADSAEESK